MFNSAEAMGDSAPPPASEQPRVSSSEGILSEATAEASETIKLLQGALGSSKGRQFSAPSTPPSDERASLVTVRGASASRSAESPAANRLRATEGAALALSRAGLPQRPLSEHSKLLQGAGAAAASDSYTNLDAHTSPPQITSGGRRNYILPAPKLEAHAYPPRSLSQMKAAAAASVQKSVASQKSVEGADMGGGEDEDEANEENSGTLLALLFAAYVLFALANRLLQKLETIPMYNYPVFLNLLTTAAYIPISFAYIIPMMRYGTQITKEQTEIPKYKFFVMGFLDCVASTMQIFGVNYLTSGSTIVLIQQSAIPISMVMSKLTLGASYSGSQYSGAALVCLGIVVVLSPQLVGPADSKADSGAAAGPADSDSGGGSSGGGAKL
mmetsp:Transcript_57475/g.130225  ORF Transcript_57475/g.130225 Transcript_57475/m.130225 type:complete len:385 (+) Transcript_57475:146-1300(+)